MQNLARVVTKEQVLAALEDLISNNKKLAKSTVWDLIYKEQAFPPKEVVRHAASLHDIDWMKYSLNGGDSCNDPLREMGFEIRKKDQSGVEHSSLNNTIVLNGRKLYKLSMGALYKGVHRNSGIIDRAVELSIGAMHRNTPNGQGEKFAKGVHIGDLIYLTCGMNRLEGIYEITSDAKPVTDELEEMIGEEGWICRDMNLLYSPSKSNTVDSKDYKEFWMPSGNSTLHEIRKDQLSTANKRLFNPYYDLTVVSTTSQESEDMKSEFRMPNPNIILYGPPGTGKTYNTVKMAAELVLKEKIRDEDYEKTAVPVFNEYLRDQIDFITFHQNYSYEDFVQGLRPHTEGEGLSFTKSNGIFYKICEKAKENYLKANGKAEEQPVSFEEVFEEFVRPLVEDEKEIEISMKREGYSYHLTRLNDKNLSFRKMSGSSLHTLSISTLKGLYEGSREYAAYEGLGIYYHPLVDVLKLKAEEIQEVRGEQELEEEKNFVLIIDEINRANISRVFGELITLIEKDKRLGAKHKLSVRLPSGDEFVVPPNLYIIGTMNTADKSIALLDIALRRRFEFEMMYPNSELVVEKYQPLFVELNKQITERRGADFQIGHAYFMEEEKNSGFDLEHTMNSKVIPLLYEYFMNDDKAVEDLLMAVDVATVRKFGMLRYDSYPSSESNGTDEQND